MMPRAVGGEAEDAGGPAPTVVPFRVLAATKRPDLHEDLQSLCGSKFAIRCHADSSADPDALLAELPHSRPHILLLDLTMPGYRDRRMLGEIRACLPDTRVILLWNDPSELDIDSIIDHSIQACQHLGSLEILARAIPAVLAGESWLPRWLEQQIILRLREKLRSARFSDASGSALGPDREPRLTPREQAVFDLVRSGLSNKEVARSMDIAEDTVKKHLKQIFSKLGIHRRIQIALFKPSPLR